MPATLLFLVPPLTLPTKSQWKPIGIYSWSWDLTCISHYFNESVSLWYGATFDSATILPITSHTWKLFVECFSMEKLINKHIYVQGCRSLLLLSDFGCRSEFIETISFAQANKQILIIILLLMSGNMSYFYWLFNAPKMYATVVLLRSSQFQQSFLLLIFFFRQTFPVIWKCQSIVF